jgi:hypothetical protein
MIRPPKQGKSSLRPMEITGKLPAGRSDFPQKQRESNQKPTGNFCCHTRNLLPFMAKISEKPLKIGMAQPLLNGIPIWTLVSIKLPPR